MVAWKPPPFLLSSEPRRFTLSKPILQGVFVEYIKQQHEARQKAWHEAKALLDAAAAEKRDLTAEENAKYETISADLDSRAKVIETL